VRGCVRAARTRGLCSTHYNSDEPAAMTAEDTLAAAYLRGRIDRRTGQPRKVDIADTSEAGALYTEGYDSVTALPALPVRSLEVTVTLPVDVLLAARRVLWGAGEHEAAVRVLQAYAQARTPADQPAAVA
jgi:hypothetical protein